MTEQPATPDETTTDDNAGQPTDPFTPLDQLPAAPPDPEENHVDAREQAAEYTGEPDDVPRAVDGAQDDDTEDAPE